MAQFVHLTPRSRVPLIRRVGIRRLRDTFGRLPKGVFAVPVSRSFYISHQWLRELKRRGQSPIDAIYFRIPDDELVSVGHFHQSHQWMTAAESVAEFDAADDRLGWEVVIPRAIDSREIVRVRVLPQVIGWRFFPKAKGNRPVCTCRFCTRGDYGSAALRKKFPRSDDE